MEKKLIDQLSALNRTVPIDTTRCSGPIDAIVKERKKEMTEPLFPTKMIDPFHKNVPPTEGIDPTHKLPQIKMTAIDGYILPVDQLTMLMYLLATHFSKDPKVKKVLDAFSFQFHDVNGEDIYPKGKKKK